MLPPNGTSISRMTPVGNASIRNGLYENGLCFSWMALVRAIGALKPTALRVPCQRLVSDHVTARYHHGRVLVRRLLFRDGANEDGVELIGWREGYFDLELGSAHG